VDLGKGGAGDRQLHQIGLGEEARAEAVVQVVVVIGHVVGNGRDLRLGAGIGVQPQVLLGVVFDQRGGQRALQRRPVGGDQRAVVLGDAFQRLPGQVQPVEIGVVL